VSGAFAAAAAALPAGASVTVTCSPVKGLDPTLELCERLVGAGFIVTPHLAARSVRDHGHLGDVLARLDAARITRVFVVAGDAKVTGAFPDGLSLLRAVRASGHRFAEIGVPAYPDGHPFIPADALMRALLDKQPYATYATTQLCYDAAKIAAWIASARGAGLALPLEVGVPGPADVAKLLRVSARIGVADSAGYLRKNRGLIGAVLRRRAFRPDPMLAALGPVFADPDAGVERLHVYAFGQVGAAVAWQSRTLAGTG
jgi:methylenetetrahydrofolate reductase (NADPH)